MATIKQRGKSWYIQYTDPATQKHVRRSLGKIKKSDAERIKRQVELQTSPAATLLAPAAAPTVSQFLDDYLEWHASEYPSSAERIAQILEQHIEPTFGDTAMDILEPMDAERWKAARLRAGAKRATINKELQTFKALLSRAVKWRVLKTNPIQGVSGMTITDSKPPRFYSLDEMRSIYAGSPHHEDIWRLLANAGLRRGEALHVQKSHIRSDRIEVQSTEDSRTKSGKWREVPINAQSNRAIKALLRNSTGSHLLPQVVPRSLSRAFDNCLRRAALDGSLHCLRHTYCSHLVMGGIPLRVVQTLAGHANYSTTERYAHLAPDQVTSQALTVNI